MVPEKPRMLVAVMVEVVVPPVVSGMLDGFAERPKLGPVTVTSMLV
jgi:hypothetical protein